MSFEIGKKYVYKGGPKPDYFAEEMSYLLEGEIIEVKNVGKETHQGKALVEDTKGREWFLDQKDFIEAQSKYTEREQRIIESMKEEIERQRTRQEEAIQKERETRKTLIPNIDELEKQEMGMMKKRGWAKYAIYLKDYLDITHYTWGTQIYPLPEDKKVIKMPMIYAAYYDLNGKFIDFGTHTRKFGELKTSHSREGHTCVGNHTPDYKELNKKEPETIKKELMKIKELLTLINLASPLITSREMTNAQIKAAVTYAEQKRTEIQATERNTRRTNHINLTGEGTCQNCEQQYLRETASQRVRRADLFCSATCMSDFLENYGEQCRECGTNVLMDELWEETDFCSEECNDSYWERNFTCTRCDQTGNREDAYTGASGELYCDYECAERADDLSEDDEEERRRQTEQEEEQTEETTTPWTPTTTPWNIPTTQNNEGGQ